MPSVIDLFAGAGGFGLGFIQAGYELNLSLEIDQWASDTLRFNHPLLQVVQADIQDFQHEGSIRDICTNSPDVIIGGPPCQGFSISGPAQKDPHDPRNTLFMDFAHWVEVLQPRVFVMENVKGLLSRKNSKGESVVKLIEATSQRLGYQTQTWLLNAAEYGVPQIRERVFVVGTKTMQLHPPPKTHHLVNKMINHKMLDGFEKAESLPAVTLWEAISDLTPLQAGEGAENQPYICPPESDFQQWIRSQSNAIYNHVAMKHTHRMVERFKHIQWGQSVTDAPIEYAPRKRGDNQQTSETVYDQNNRRLRPDRPSHTITASFYANFIHPFQHRNLTAREGARLQSFPDTYQFKGKPTVVSRKLLKREGRVEEDFLCQYNQIGNAVPPLLAYHIANHILKECF